MSSLLFFLPLFSSSVFFSHFVFMLLFIILLHLHSEYLDY